MMKTIIDEEPALQEYVITEKKFMELFWKYFEFNDELVREIKSIPKMRNVKLEADGLIKSTTKRPQTPKDITKLDFYEANRSVARPESAWSEAISDAHVIQNSNVISDRYEKRGVRKEVMSELDL